MGSEVRMKDKAREERDGYSTVLKMTSASSVTDPKPTYKVILLHSTRHKASMHSSANSMNTFLDARSNLCYTQVQC